MRRFLLSFLIATSSLFSQLQNPLLRPECAELFAVDHIEFRDDLKFNVDAVQEKWLRAPGQELWHIDERLNDKQKERIWNSAKKLGFVERCYPKQRKYEECLLLGATTHVVRKRLNFLARLWQQGVRFKRISFLTGHRPLNEWETTFLDLDGTTPLDLENEKCPTNESEMMQLYFRKASLPAEIKALPFQLIAAPMQLDRRPTRKDTVNAWLKKQQKGSCLFISNQPYCLYDEAMISSIIKKKFHFEVVGDKLLKENFKSPTAFLDTFARWYYQTYHNQEGN